MNCNLGLYFLFFLAIRAFVTQSCANDGLSRQSINSEDFLEHTTLNYMWYMSLQCLVCATVLYGVN